MKEFSIVPIYRQGMQELSEGIEIKIPKFCNNNCYKSSKCREYYKQIYELNEGVSTCPYGFNSYIFNNNGEKIIFSCMRIRNYYERKRVDSKIDESDSNRIIELQQIEQYAELYREFDESTKRFDEYYDFIENIFHDVRKYNAQLKAITDKIYHKAEGNSKKFEHFLNQAKSMRSTTWFISLRLNSYDFAYNEEIMSQTIKSSYNIRKIFDKIRHCMKKIIDEKNLRINIETNGSCMDIQAYDSIENLPFILVDNAIKYAPNNTEVNINIEDSVDALRFSVSSIGPVLLAGEDEKIFNRKYRSETAEKLTKDGSGIGLYTAKKICELHKAQIYAKSDPSIIPIKGDIKYSWFSIFVSLKRQY